MRKMSRLIVTSFLMLSVMLATGSAAWADPGSNPVYLYLLRHPGLYGYLPNHQGTARPLMGKGWQKYPAGPSSRYPGYGQYGYGGGYQQLPGQDGLQYQFPSNGDQEDQQQPGDFTGQNQNSEMSQLEQLAGGGGDDTASSGTVPGMFSDVPSWARQAVGAMSGRGIIKGLGRGIFGSNQTLTRAQFTVLLVREFDLLSTSGSVYGSVNFVDVPSTFWAYQYIEAATPYMTYWNTGGQATFHPADPADREDAVVAMVEAAGLANQSVDASSVLSKFADAGSISPGLVNLVAIAVQSGLVSGIQGSDGNWYLYPQATLTRAQGAVLLYRALAYTKVAPGGATPPAVTQTLNAPPVAQSVYGG